MKSRLVNSYITRSEKLREHFLSIHVQELYGKLTNCGSKFLRVEQLVIEAATNRTRPGP